MGQRRLLKLALYITWAYPKAVGTDARATNLEAEAQGE